jgi:hypothetical protein
MKANRRILNSLTRQPIIAQRADGKNPSGAQSALQVRAIRNPQATPYATPQLRKVFRTK